MSPLLIAYAISFGIADRMWGGDVKHGRRWSILIALGAGLGLGFYRDGLTGLEASGALVVAFLLTRSMGFHMFGGSSTPRTLGRFLALILRHAVFMVPVAALVAWKLLDASPVMFSAWFAGWALAAGILGLAYGQVNAKARHDGRPVAPIANQIVESLRGVFFGATLCLALGSQ